MHELGMAQDLFKIVETKARDNNLKNITKISIKVGVASGVEKDFLRHSFVDHIFPKSLAAGAELELIDESLAAKCEDCEEAIGAPDGSALNCPTCGSFRIKIMKGKDIYVESIEGDI